MDKTAFFLAGAYNNIKRNRPNPYWNLLVLVTLFAFVHIGELILMAEIWGVNLPQLTSTAAVAIACAITLSFQIFIRWLYPQSKLESIRLTAEEQKKIDLIQIKYAVVTFLFLVFLMIRQSYLE